MLRSDSGADLRQLHVDGLRDAYQHFNVSKGDNDALHVDVHLDVPCDNAASETTTLTVYVVLDHQFPLTAPTISAATGRRLRSAPIGEAWQGDRHVLAEAVREAFAHLRELWGPVRPPTLRSLAASLQSLSADTLADLVSNSQCRESFSYQLPVSKQMREEMKVLADRVERLAQSNAESSELLSHDVQTLEGAQTALGEIRAWLLLEAEKGRIADLMQYSSDDAIAKLFAKEAKQWQMESETVEKQLLMSGGPRGNGEDASNQPSIDNVSSSEVMERLKEQYLKCRLQFHDVELRRRAFAASLKK